MFQRPSTKKAHGTIRDAFNQEPAREWSADELASDKELPLGLVLDIIGDLFREKYIVQVAANCYRLNPERKQS